jgi:ABC-type transporter Mla maintaining outer membrane lipid asymmetry permease subunit MlaE
LTCRAKVLGLGSTDALAGFAAITLRADFQHLRRWRKSVEQAQSYTFKTVITVVATGLLGAVWLGVKIALGK